MSKKTILKIINSAIIIIFALYSLKVVFDENYKELIKTAPVFVLLSLFSLAFFQFCAVGMQIKKTDKDELEEIKNMKKGLDTLKREYKEMRPGNKKLLLIGFPTLVILILIAFFIFFVR